MRHIIRRVFMVGAAVLLVVLLTVFTTEVSQSLTSTCPERDCYQSSACPQGGPISCSFSGRRGGDCVIGSIEVYCSDGSVVTRTYVRCWGILCSGASYLQEQVCPCSGSGGGGGPGDPNPE